MKLIKPSVELWQQINTIDGIWKHAAKCARVCYQSQPINDKESSKDFLLRTIAKNGFKKDKSSHMSVLEHSTVYLKVINNTDNSYLYDRYYANHYSRAVYDVNKTDNTVQVCVTTNLRVLVENDWLDDLRFISHNTTKHISRYTFSIITNLGVSRELNRHRCHSISEESTRYCNYSKDKFDKQLTFVIPEWSGLEEQTIKNTARFVNDDSVSHAELLWLSSCLFAENRYIHLINHNWKPQQAREVLPLALKTQVIHTAFEDDWKDFIALRSDGISGAPHPNIKVIANKIRDLIYYY